MTNDLICHHDILKKRLTIFGKGDIVQLFHIIQCSSAEMIDSVGCNTALSYLIFVDRLHSHREEPMSSQTLKQNRSTTIKKHSAE